MANRSHKPVTDASGKPQNNRTATSTPPRYIVMPAQDEADYIAAALESLITQVLMVRSNLERFRTLW
jgi:hypothetical protein